MAAEAAPWCILLSPSLDLGCVEEWTPLEMLRLRATCHAFRWHSSRVRGGSQTQDSAAFFADVLVQGLGIDISMSYPHSSSVETRQASQYYAVCRRIFMERLLISSLPRVAAAAAELDQSTDAAQSCAVIGGGYALHRRLLEDY